MDSMGLTAVVVQELGFGGPFPPCPKLVKDRLQLK